MQILKTIVDYLTKMLAVGVPLYGPLIAKFPGLAWLLGTETSRAIVSAALFTALFLFDARGLYSTSVGVDEFLREYVDGLDLGITADHWGTDLRLNVMYLRREWRLLGLVRSFQWRGSKGFDTPGVVHPDERLWLLACQGVAGQARKGQPAYVPTPPTTSTWKIWRTLWLFPWQVEKTRGLKAILSVPMVRDSTKGKRRVVGVLNLDAISAAGAIYLNQKRQILTTELAKVGKHLSRLP